MQPTDRLARHLDYMRWRNLSGGTIYQRRRLLERLAVHAGTDAWDASTDDLLNFLDRRQRDGTRLSPKTRAVEIAHFASFYKWLVMEGYREDDPTLRVPRPKLPRSLPHPMAEDDLARAVDGAPPRVRPWLFLAGWAGLRAKEIAGLRGEDIWWASDPVLIVVTEGKGGDEGAVPMAPILEPVLRVLPRRGWLFPRQDGLWGPTTPWCVSRITNLYLHSIGIPETLHSLRHRFCTQVYRTSGRDLRQTQELARHRSIQSTVGYTQVDQSEAAGIVGAIPGLRLRSVRA